MSEQKIRPRVIIELQPDGTFVLETYINGARSRYNISPAFQEVAHALFEKLKEINNAEERAAARKLKEAEARHKRVWTNVAADHGTHFANQTVGALERPNPKPKGIPTGLHLL